MPAVILDMTSYLSHTFDDLNDGSCGTLSIKLAEDTPSFLTTPNNGALLQISSEPTSEDDIASVAIHLTFTAFLSSFEAQT